MRNLKKNCNKKLIAGIGILALLAIVLPAPAQPGRPVRPNIIYIMADDHTSQAWGIYGGILKDYIQNHNILRLAAKGAVLNNVFCTNSICTPSRATILTGQYSNQNGVYTLSDFLEPEHHNIAKNLQAAGYQTALFGKWHLKKMPTGFDSFKVLPGQGKYHNPLYLDKTNWNDNEAGGEPFEGYVDDITTAMSIDWMKQRNTDQPFFLMCHFKSTHEPFDFPDRFKDLYKDITFPYPPTFEDSGAVTTGRSFLGQRLEVLGDRYVKASVAPEGARYPELPFSIDGLTPLETRKKIYQKFIKDYLRCVAGIDENIGKLLDYLESTGLDKNTVVIYTSDQGYFLGEHDFMDKRLIYEESLRMPFVIAYPREIRGGSRINDIILNTDFAALFADYAAIPQPGYIQGSSFRKNLQGNTPKNWRTDLYYRYWQHLEARPAHLGIRNERYKLIFFYGLPLNMTGAGKKKTEPAWEFYDLQKDPHETRNAIHDASYQAIIKQMKQRLIILKAAAGDSDDILTRQH